MAIVFEANEKDFLFGRLLAKGWYQFEIVNIVAKPKSGDKEKTTLHIICGCIGGKDDNGPAAGVEITKYFSTEKLGGLIKFGKDLGIPDLEAGKRFDVERWKGFKFDAHVQPKQYEDNNYNDINEVTTFGKMTNL